MGRRDWCAEFGFQPVINAVGYATRVSGSCPHPEVVAAMAEASGAYFEIDDLLAAASREIARATGAEAGIVTCGAGAALSLGAAACLAGNRPERMDELPDTTGCERNEIIFPQPGPFDYDHAVRLSGARLRLIDYHAADALAQIEAAIGPRTAAVGYVWLEMEERPPIAALAELAHRHGLPLLVDGACALPPGENLRGFSRDGADLVAYSGGKHLGGPQASGILCGREELVRSAWVQMVDMDVRGGTWSLRHWVEQGWIVRAPRHGIGRSMKVSKEAMVGVMVALRRYASRDAQAEYAGWSATVDEIYDGLRDVGELRIARHAAGANGQPYPNVRVESGRVRVEDLQRALRERPRRILLAEDERTPDRAVIFPQCLQAGEAAEIVAAVRETVKELR
ncbi:MAG: aminotransferase class V-fold PLP-dependent enzyme [bacterium]